MKIPLRYQTSEFGCGPPGAMIVVLVICVNFIGDALRDAKDPTTIR